MTGTIEPVQVAIEVRRGIEEAFRVFTDEIAAWWPVAGHSVEPDQVEAVVLEGRLGGRLFERWHGGGEADWGRVVAWEPPERLVMTRQGGAGQVVKTCLAGRAAVAWPVRLGVVAAMARHRGAAAGRAADVSGRPGGRVLAPIPGQLRTADRAAGHDQGLGPAQPGVQVQGDAAHRPPPPGAV